MWGPMPLRGTGHTLIRLCCFIFLAGSKLKFQCLSHLSTCHYTIAAIGTFSFRKAFKALGVQREGAGFSTRIHACFAQTLIHVVSYPESCRIKKLHGNQENGLRTDIPTP